MLYSLIETINIKDLTTNEMILAEYKSHVDELNLMVSRIFI